MAISNITVVSGADATSASLSITDAAGNNRKVFGIVTQDRNPNNYTGMTLDGVAGTLVGTVTHSGGAIGGSIYEWNDAGTNGIASMPAGSGSFTIAVTGSSLGTDISCHGIACSGAKQTAAASWTSDTASAAEDPSFTLTADAGSLAVIFCIDASNTQTLTNGASQTDITAPVATGGATCGASYDSADLTVSYTRSASSNWASGAAAIEPAAGVTLTDVDTDETVQTAQTGRTYTGTGLTDADGMVFIVGSTEVAVTAFSATNATSGTFTAPTLAAVRTAGVKFGSGTWQIEDGGVSLATLAGTLNPETGWTAHNVTDISQAADTGCIYYGQSPAVAVGDQVLFDNTTTTNAWAVTLDAQGFVEVASGGSTSEDSFQYYVWDDTDDSWGTVGVFTVNEDTGSVGPIAALYLRKVMGG